MCIDIACMVRWMENMYFAMNGIHSISWFWERWIILWQKMLIVCRVEPDNETLRDSFAFIYFIYSTYPTDKLSSTKERGHKKGIIAKSILFKFITEFLHFLPVASCSSWSTYMHSLFFKAILNISIRREKTTCSQENSCRYVNSN